MPTSSFGSLSVTSPCGIEAVLLQQCFRRACFCHCPIRKRHDLVCSGHGAHPMSNHQHGLICNQAGKSRLNQGFILYIKRSRGFVQKNNRGIFQKSTSDGNPLPLTAGKLAAVFADMGVPAIRQLYGKFVHIGKPCRSQPPARR